MKLFSRKKEDAKKISIYAPFKGKCVDITEVPDEVFAQKMMGDGVAILQEDELVRAPVAGEISMIATTKHAVGIDIEEGLQILIHVGLETVNLQGQGFEVLVKEHQHVKVGDPILKVDIAFMKQQGINLIVPMVIMDTNAYTIQKPALGNDVNPEQDVIIEILK